MSREALNLLSADLAAELNFTILATLHRHMLKLVTRMTDNSSTLRTLEATAMGMPKTDTCIEAEATRKRYAEMLESYDGWREELRNTIDAESFLVPMIKELASVSPGGEHAARRFLRMLSAGAEFDQAQKDKLKQMMQPPTRAAAPVLPPVKMWVAVAVGIPYTTSPERYTLCVRPLLPEADEPADKASCAFSLKLATEADVKHIRSGTIDALRNVHGIKYAGVVPYILAAADGKYELVLELRGSPAVDQFVNASVDFGRLAPVNVEFKDHIARLTLTAGQLAEIGWQEPVEDAPAEVKPQSKPADPAAGETVWVATSLSRAGGGRTLRLSCEYKNELISGIESFKIYAHDLNKHMPHKVVYATGVLLSCSVMPESDTEPARLRISLGGEEAAVVAHKELEIAFPGSLSKRVPLYHGPHAIMVPLSAEEARKLLQLSTGRAVPAKLNEHVCDFSQAVNDKLMSKDAEELMQQAKLHKKSAD